MGALSHIKSNTIGDFTGTVTIYNSQGSTTTANATDLVRPSDWNSAHNVFQTISGNTAGSSTMSGTNIVFQGSGNLTLSASTAAGAATLIFSAATQTNQTVASGNIAGTGLTTTTTAGVAIVGTNSTNGLSLGIPNFITTAMASNAATISNINISAGTTSTNASAFTFNNANGISFGLGTGASAGSITASHNALTTARASNDAVGLNTAQTNVTWTVNSSGISLNAGGYAGTGTSATNASITLNSNGLAISVGAGGGGTNATWYATGNTVSSSTGTIALSSIIFNGAGGVSAGISNGSVIVKGPDLTSLSATGALSASSNGSTISLGVGTVTATATGSTTLGSSGTINLNGLIFAGSGAAQVGISNGSVVISAPNAGAGNITVSAGTTSSGLASIIFANSNGVSFGLNTGSVITASAAGGGGGIGAGMSNLGNTAGTSGTVTTGNVVFVGTGPISLSQSSSGSNATISINAPATSSLVGASGLSISTAGSTISVYEAPGQQWEPFPISTGSAVSSHAPASIWFNRVYVTEPLTLSRFNLYASMSAQAGSATSVASTGTARFTYTKGMTIFTRQNTGTGSTNLTTLSSGSFGLTAGVSYSSTSQSVVVSWVTDSTGGTSSFNTTSNSSGWVSWLSGMRQFAIPMNATIQPGEYFVAHQHSSTTATTASNFVLASVSLLHIAPQVVQFQTLGTTGTIASLNVGGLGDGIASAVTTNATMAGSVISHGTRNQIYIAASGF